MRINIEVAACVAMDLSKNKKNVLHHKKNHAELTIQSHAVHLSEHSGCTSVFLSWTTIFVFTKSADRRVTGRKLSNRREITLAILHTVP